MSWNKNKILEITNSDSSKYKESLFEILVIKSERQVDMIDNMISKV